ncbi:peptidylprolyl isomerase [Candidatus Woesearchaeota archaeon]|nr:peptidylprolyl isomerase [Candidatus Woesearchaeota archaeon]
MLKKGDFVELDYTGRIKDDKVVFDTTDEQMAKDSNIHTPKYKYKPVIICLGEKHLIQGLDDALIGKNPGKYTIEVKAEHAFGKKTPTLLKLIPARLFEKDNVKPFVGLEVNVDGTLGIVRSAGGGRVIVDFNHPLASKDLVYDVDVKRIVTDSLEKTKALLELMNVPFEDIDVVDDKAVITTKTKLPEPAVKGLADNIKKLVKLKSIDFKTQEEVKKELKKEENKTEDKSSGPSNQDLKKTAAGAKEKEKEGKEKEKKKEEEKEDKEKKDL